MRNHFKYLLISLVFIGYSAVRAGSYEDFFQAIKQDRASFVQSLLQRGFDANVRDPNGQHGLYLALSEPSLKVAKVLLDWPKTDVNALSPNGESALMMAALRGHNDMARQLLARDADVNKTGWTPLHYAATAGNLELMALLLENHAYIDAESPNGTTPLMMAAQYGTPSAVKLLLDEGADPLIKNQLQLTAIDFAQQGNRPDSVELISGVIKGTQQKPP
jgi:uncharacterized protein